MPVYINHNHSLGLIMQEQHQEQITEIRKAGHDALAVIVEEYKVW